MSSMTLVIHIWLQWREHSALRKPAKLVLSEARTRKISLQREAGDGISIQWHEHSARREAVKPIPVNFHVSVPVSPPAPPPLPPS